MTVPPYESSWLKGGVSWPLGARLWLSAKPVTVPHAEMRGNLCTLSNVGVLNESGAVRWSSEPRFNETTGFRRRREPVLFLRDGFKARVSALPGI